MPDPLVSTTRLRALRSALGTGDRPLLVAIHDYPDPDAIAAALAFQTLSRSWGIPAVIAHGGVIGREENSEMVRLLNIDLKTFDSIPDLAAHRGAIVVDTQPLAKNQSLPDDIEVLAVIDHHSLGGDSVRVVHPGVVRNTTARILYTDIRLDVGASSTLALGYLQAAGMTPDARLATALFLGVKTDTDGLLRDSHPADVDAYVQLLPLANLAMTAMAIHPPLEPEYFRFLHIAVEQAAVHGSTLLTCCGDVKTPDMLSTASDTLIPLRGVNYALAVGFHAERAYLSLRAKAPHADATRVLMHVVEPDGKGGGHNLSAGGFIDMPDNPEACFERIRVRLLEATGDLGNSGQPLIRFDA